MLYVLVDDHGTPLGESDDRAAAIRALDELIAADPSAAEDCGITVSDEEGRRGGDPISRPATA
jgi:hypothetical protein